MNASYVIKLMEESHDEYFSVFIENYPSFYEKDLLPKVPLDNLFDLSITMRACAVRLGNKALNRFEYLGFNELYPFNNPVDHYNWLIDIVKERTPLSTYASVESRFRAELKMLRKLADVEGVTSYDDIPEELFLVSKSRYKFPTPVPVSSGEQNIATTSHDEKNEDCCDDFEKVHKLSVIGVNATKIVKAIQSLFI